MAKPVKLFFIDDSGSEKSGLAVLGWLELDIADWALVLGRVLEWRQSLAQAHAIPKSYELHAVQFVNGRGNPTSDDAWNRVKHFRRTIATDLAHRVGTWSDVHVRGLVRQSQTRRHGYQLEREQAYEDFVEYAELTLEREDAYGLVFVDGDGTQSMYRRAHRNLDLRSRRIIEDPVFQHSHASHIIQVADFVAYALFQEQIRNPEKEFSWNWFASAGGELLA